MNSTPVKTSRNAGPQRFLVSIPLLLGLILLVGCRKAEQTAADTDPVGTYTLVSVDGNKVPCTIQHGNQSVKVESGTFTINADGTCASRMVFAPPSGKSVDRQVRATYTREGSKLTMKWEGAGMTMGEAQGDSFTMNNEGNLFAYKR